MSLSLSPHSLYRQTTDCTEGGGLMREHCSLIKKKNRVIFHCGLNFLSLMKTEKYRCLLPSSGTIKMDYEENMENVRYATNDDIPL
jgi:hypothetical protein